jgi:Leucine-rich repeat (LRR) protein
MIAKNVMTGLVLIMLAGCENYQVTLNQRELYSPPTLFADFEVTNAGLRACIEQTIADQNILRAEQLTVLVCTYSGIETLSGLGRFTQLETINLANNKLSDIKPLMFLGQLQLVDISGNPNLACAEIKSLKDLLPTEPITSQSCAD